MAKVENFDFPMGWLVDPHKKWAIHFDPKKESADLIESEFTIDMWGVGPNGKPLKFKSRRKSSKEDSEKTWKQLLSSKWIKVDFEKIKSA
tara:strand:- start:306 stop:575 length:270 start_codon:yes stop_codon:yes gene_type:complete